MKHTPGPWKAVNWNCHAPTTVMAGGNVVVAECSGHGRHTNESLGDARLIAAAPEMAELLLSSYTHVSHGGPTMADVVRVLRKAGLLDSCPGMDSEVQS